uniref:Uncharacterized protein n=1 Tax=Noccaea caerulescens TaxID=107243 RepID=A0A1J3HZR6_NOCCA
MQRQFCNRRTEKGNIRPLLKTLLVKPSSPHNQWNLKRNFADAIHEFLHSYLIFGSASMDGLRNGNFAFMGSHPWD